MNLGYHEDQASLPHYAEAAAALATKLGDAADLGGAAVACDVGFGSVAGAVPPRARDARRARAISDQEE